MRLVIIVILVSLSISCGRHSSQNRSHTNPGDTHTDPKPGSPGGHLQEAIAKDDIATVVKLLDSGFTVDELLPNGKTALIDSAWQSKLRIMVELLGRGADRAIKSSEGKTALEHAKEAAGADEEGNPNITRAIVLLDPRLQDEFHMELMKYTGRGSADPLNRLLADVGINPNFVAADGNTPLTLAIRSNKLVSVTVLSRWKDCVTESSPSNCLRLTATDINMPGSDGIKPLALAKQTGAEEIIEVLINEGAQE